MIPAMAYQFHFAEQFDQQAKRQRSKRIAVYHPDIFFPYQLIKFDGSLDDRD
jgi:hypothetical protein